MTDEEAANGVVTHSSGNHAQAIALAAKNRGIPAYIVMPSTTPDIKKVAVLGYGANVIECEPIQSAREAAVRFFKKNQIISFFFLLIYVVCIGRENQS